MWEYSDKVKKHFLKPKNVGVIKNADGVGEVGSLACGDVLKLTFKMGKDNKIKDAKFQTFGCASAIASSSALTEILKGKTLEEAEKITNEDIVKYLGGLPKEKIHCSVMGKEALGKAILFCKGEEKKTSDGEILCDCFEVTDNQIIRSIKEKGINTIDEVINLLKAGGGCGNCHNKIKKIIDDISEGETSNIYKKNITNIQKIKMIQEALIKYIKPDLKQDGGDIELIDVDNNKVLVRLIGACASCSKSKITLKHHVETKLREIVSPEITVEEA